MRTRCLIGLLLLARPAPAAPDAPAVRVRSRARVEISEVRRSRDGIVVIGALRDLLADEGVAGKRVAVQLRDASDGREQFAVTGGDGAFAAEFRVPRGRYEIEARLAPDADYVALAPAARGVDVAKRQVALHLDVPTRLRKAAGRLPIAILVRDEGTAAALPISLRVQGREVDHVTTGLDGAASAELPVEGRPGEWLAVQARFAGDAARDAARSERGVLLTTGTVVAARLATPELPRGERLRVNGQVEDSEGPLGGVTIEIATLDGAPLGAATSDASGRFAATLATRGLPIGRLRLVARYEPTVAFREPGRSPPLELTLLPAAPLPLLPWLLPPLLTGLAWAGAEGLRRRPWQRWRRSRSERAPTPARPPRGVVLARPGLLSRLRPPEDHGLSGVVWDEAFDLPVAATIAVRGERDFVVTCDVDGGFVLPDLPRGRWELSFSAPGYRGERLGCELPHRGEQRGMRVALSPLRAELMALYVRLAAAWAGSDGPTGSPPPPHRAGTGDGWTPRELRREIAARGEVPPEFDQLLGQLLGLVEQGYYSLRRADEGDVDVARRLSQQVSPSRPRARPPSSPVE